MLLIGNKIIVCYVIFTYEMLNFFSRQLQGCMECDWWFTAPLRLRGTGLTWPLYNIPSKTGISNSLGGTEDDLLWQEPAIHDSDDSDSDGDNVYNNNIQNVYRALYNL